MLLKKILAAAALFTLISPSAFAGKRLNCEGGMGGSSPATARIQFSKLFDGKTVAYLNLKNPSFPKGLNATFLAGDQEWDDIDNFTLTGQINDRYGSLIFNKLSDGRLRLSIYAQRDVKIEFGFGAHFICDVVR